MPETPPPATSSPTASQEDTEEFRLVKRPPEQRAIIAQGIAPEFIWIVRAEFDAVLLELQRLNDSGDCGRMVEDIVSKMESWTQ